MSVLSKKWDLQRQHRDQKKALKTIKQRKPHSDYHIDHSTPTVWKHIVDQSKKKQLKADNKRRIASLNMNTYHQIHNAKHKLDCGPTYSGHMVRVYHSNRMAKMHELERLAFDNVRKCRAKVRAAKAHEAHSRSNLQKDFLMHQEHRKNMKQSALLLLSAQDGTFTTGPNASIFNSLRTPSMDSVASIPLGVQSLPSITGNVDF